MKKAYQLSLTDELRDHLESVLEKKKSEEINAKETIETAQALLESLEASDPSDTIKDAIKKLRSLIEMVDDPVWDMRVKNKNYVMAVLSYFTESKQHIPNFMPELGVLFDAMMIDIVAEKLTHERDAYQDFKSFVKTYKKSPFYKGQELTKDDWVKARKKELRDRLKRRRRRDAKRTGFRGSNFTVI